MTGQEQLAADVLAGVVPIGDVPDHFEAAVRQHIAARPSPTPGPSQMDRIESKLDEMLTLLRGTTE